MDRRLILELLPGPAFLIGHAIGGLFAGAAVAIGATVLAILLRWRWDRDLPWLAIALLGLTLVLQGVGLVLNDPTWIKLSNTIGSLAFAAIIGVGMLARPSLLERAFGHTLEITAKGWTVLHLVWIVISLARAGANEIARRTMSDDAWAIYNGLSDLGWFALMGLATWFTAYRHWDVRA